MAEKKQGETHKPVSKSVSIGLTQDDMDKLALLETRNGINKSKYCRIAIQEKLANEPALKDDDT